MKNELNSFFFDFEEEKLFTKYEEDIPDLFYRSHVDMEQYVEDIDKLSSFKVDPEKLRHQGSSVRTTSFSSSKIEVLSFSSWKGRYINREGNKLYISLTDTLNRLSDRQLCVSPAFFEKRNVSIRDVLSHKPFEILDKRVREANGVIHVKREIYVRNFYEYQAEPRKNDDLLNRLLNYFSEENDDE